MSSDQEDLTLKFRAGELEEPLISLILALQFALGTMLVVMTVGWIYLILDSYVSSNGTVFYPEVVPVLIGTAVVVYLLNFLYE